jgi:CHAD domain-containing protein
VKHGRELAFDGIRDAKDAVALILRVRFAECLERTTALFGEDPEAMHAFRLACKRLRYAIERFHEEVPELEPAANFLARVTDTLGCANDCTVLIERSRRCGTALVAERAQQDRDLYVRRARRLWRRAFKRRGALGDLAQYAGFNWELSA